MLTFDQCLHIRDACICIKDITKRAKYRKLSREELKDLYYQLACVEAWLNTHPTLGERLYAFFYKKLKKGKRYETF